MMATDVSAAPTATLDDALFGASEDDVRAVQKAILDYGGTLSDPAWVPFAAALRMRREVERVVPTAVLSSTSAASQEASTSFRAAVSDVAERVLTDVA